MTDGHDGGKHGISWSGSGEPTPPTETQDLPHMKTADARGYMNYEEPERLFAAPTERVETRPIPDLELRKIVRKILNFGRKTPGNLPQFDAAMDEAFAYLDAAVAPSPAGESQEDGLRVHIKRRDHQAAKAYVEGHNAGLESAAHVLEGGHFMSDGSLEFKWAKQVASLIRARKTTEVQP